jgi:hypothetical protein
MCMEVKQLKDTLDKETATTSARQVATSFIDTPALANSRTTTHVTSIGGTKKLFSEIVGCTNVERQVDSKAKTTPNH